MKRLISLLLAVIMALSLCSVVAFAEGEEPFLCNIVIDGKLDEDYAEFRYIPSNWWQCYSSNTELYMPVDETRIQNGLYFTWDDRWLYLYAVCVSADDLYVAPGTYTDMSQDPNWMERMSIWLDTHPSAPTDQALTNDNRPCADLDRNCITGADPYHRLQLRYTPAYDKFHNYFRTDEGMFQTFEEFSERRGGEAGYEDLEAMYKKENGDAEVAGFVDYETNTYGVELKYPVVPGEEGFRVQMGTSANEKDWGDPDGVETGYVVSFGPAWWRDFPSMLTIYYESVPGGDPRVKECQRLIGAIPQDVQLTDEAAITAAKQAFDLLNDEQKAHISYNQKKRLESAQEIVGLLKKVGAWATLLWTTTSTRKTPCWRCAWR